MEYSSPTEHTIPQLPLKRFPLELTTVGISLIVLGFFLSLTIIFSLIGIPLLLAGIKLIQAATRFNRLENTGDIADFVSAFQQLRGYFQIFFWFILLSLVLTGYALYLLYQNFAPLFEFLMNSPAFT